MENEYWIQEIGAHYLGKYGIGAMVEEETQIFGKEE